MGSMFREITAWDNLWLAYRKAARGKRRRASAAAFEHQVADRLLALQADLRSKTYRPGAYCHFFIHEPKRRNAVKFTRRLERNLDAYRTGRISFAELDASVQGWINHVRYADTWGLREHLFEGHPIPVRTA
jgi:hypothetical protein